MGIFIRYATTNGSRSAQGIQEAIQALVPSLKVQRLADPVHLSQHLFPSGLRTEFRETMFLRETKAEHKQLKQIFSLDL